jgi:N-acetylneuraminic acid mutarotase
MNVARGGFGAAVLDGRIVVIGGEVLSGPNTALTSVEVFDPQTESWTAGPDLPVGLHGVPAAAVNSELYILGGSDRAGSIDNKGRVLISVISEQ